MQAPCRAKLRCSEGCYQKVIFYTELKQTHFLALTCSLYRQFRVYTYIHQPRSSLVAKTALIAGAV